MISKPLDLIAISAKQEPFQNNSQKSSLWGLKLRITKSTLHHALSNVREGVKTILRGISPCPPLHLFWQRRNYRLWSKPSIPSWGKNTQTSLYYYTYMCMMSLQQNTKQFTTKCTIFVVLNGVSCHSMQKQFLKRYESTLHKIVLSSNLIGKTETKSLVLCLTLVLTQSAG